MVGWMVGWLAGQLNGWTDRWTDGIPLVKSIQTEQAGEQLGKRASKSTRTTHPMALISDPYVSNLRNC